MKNSSSASIDWGLLSDIASVIRLGVHPWKTLDQAKEFTKCIPIAPDSTLWLPMPELEEANNLHNVRLNMQLIHGQTESLRNHLISFDPDIAQIDSRIGVGVDNLAHPLKWLTYNIFDNHILAIEELIVWAVMIRDSILKSLEEA